MRQFIIRRIFLFIPGIFFVVLFSFILLHLAPGDPVDRLLSNQGVFDQSLSSLTANNSQRDEIRKQLGLDLPLFYFSISSLEEKNTLHNQPAQDWQAYVPSISIHSNNQFHRWLFGDDNYSDGILRGDFGISWMTGQPVSDIISGRLRWSLFFTLISVFLAFLISIPAGLKAASKPGSPFDRIMSGLTIIVFSLPSFWIATLLMLLFCNPDVLNWFPSSGVAPTGGFSEDQSLWTILLESIPYLILPTFCYTYSAIAFISASVKAAASDILREDFIRTARAKGVSERGILDVHTLRNAWLPMITIFSQVFPLAIGGSVILETIFTIPGMGLAIYQSITSQDFPVIISVFMITGFVTMFGYLLADILYAVADPRISHTTIPA